MTEEYPLMLLESSSFEDNVRRWAEIYEDTTKPGHGFFFKFDETPEFKEALIKFMQHYYGWTLDYDGTFIRKPLPSAT